jgi:serine/threonine protein kinase
MGSSPGDAAGQTPLPPPSPEEHAREFFARNLLGDKLDLVHRSSACSVFRGVHPHLGSAIYKIFNEGARAAKQARSELHAYGLVGDLAGVPRVFDILDVPNMKILCMQDCGSDVFDLMDTSVDTGEWWMSGVREMALLLNQMHARGLFHGDIKMENFAWDGNRWYMLDFGFTLLYNDKSVCGTVPHLPPAIMEVPFDAIPRHYLDYYAFAITFLTIFDLPLEQRCAACVTKKSPRCTECHRNLFVIDIEKLVFNRRKLIPDCPKPKWRKDFFLGDPAPAIAHRLLCDIVLSMVDVGRGKLVWKGYETACYYQGTNRVALPPGVREQSPEQLWQQLISLF